MEASCNHSALQVGLDFSRSFSLRAAAGCGDEAELDVLDSPEMAAADEDEMDARGPRLIPPLRWAGEVRGRGGGGIKTGGGGGGGGGPICACGPCVCD